MSEDLQNLCELTGHDWAVEDDPFLVRTCKVCRKVEYRSIDGEWKPIKVMEEYGMPLVLGKYQPGGKSL